MAKPLNACAPEFTHAPSTIDTGCCYYLPPFLCVPPPPIDSRCLYYQSPQGFILCCSPPQHDPYCYYYVSPLLPQHSLISTKQQLLSQSHGGVYDPCTSTLDGGATIATLTELPETTESDQLPVVTSNNTSVTNRIRNGPRCYSGGAARRAILGPPMYRRLRKLPGTLASEWHVRDEAPSDKTTVMIRNIPNKFNKEKLVQILDDHCRVENQKLHSENDAVSEFDFVYLPMDFGSGNNLGYAFVNLTSPSAAWKLYCKFQLKDWEAFGSRKVCEVTYARLQGLSELKLHFKNSVFTCNALDYLPSCYVPARNGCRRTKRLYVGRFVPSFGRAMA